MEYLTRRYSQKNSFREKGKIMKAAIMGYGTIGSGVAETLRVNHDVIARRVGEPIELKKVLDLREIGRAHV